MLPEQTTLKEIRTIMIHQNIWGTKVYAKEFQVYLII